MSVNVEESLRAKFALRPRVENVILGQFDFRMRLRLLGTVREYRDLLDTQVSWVRISVQDQIGEQVPR